MLIPTLLLLQALGASISEPPETSLQAAGRRDCSGLELEACESGWTGPACDLACRPGHPCDFAQYCHSWGGTYGLSTFGTYLFALDPAWSSWLVTPRFLAFIVAHPASLGLAADISPLYLGLRPLVPFRSTDGGLTILKYQQSYRGFRVFGPDGVVRLIANRHGVIGVRGALVDHRLAYKFMDEQPSQATAEILIRQEVALRTGLAGDSLWLSGVERVAVPRARAIGWHARVAQGTRHIATIVLAADPLESAIPQVLHYSRDSAGALKDELPVSVLAEDMDSEVLAPPVETASVASLRDASPLLGSFAGGGPILGDERVVAYDASGVPDIEARDVLPPVADGDGVFAAPLETSTFRAQTAYLAVQNMYEWTHRLMAGRWESLLGEASTIPPELFMPRVLLYNHVDFDGCEDTAACVDRAAIKGPAPVVPDEFEQPLQGPIFEELAVMTLETVDGPGVNVIAHEFGHVVDLFADAGFISTGIPCQGELCGAPSCELDTTDESAPLTETFAQLAALWYMRTLYGAGASSESCGVLKAISKGDDRRPHNAACRPGGEPFSVFLAGEDPECPQASLCDHVFTASAATGICSDSAGYRVDSFFQAFWELLHAQACATSAPFNCDPLTALAEGVPGDRVGGAMLYALRVNTATYHGFADDAATFVACNHGPVAYQQFNSVLCHHKIRACDAPVPVDCELCGNAIQEGGEACDGSDFAGATCESQGFAGGVLLCDKNCLLDESACSVVLPTTSGGDDVPTSSGDGAATIRDDGDVPTAGPADPSASTQGESSAPAGGEGEDTGLDGTGEGCGCQSPRRDVGSAGLVAMTLFGLRTRRRRGAAGSAVLAAVLAMAGCGGGRDHETGEATTTAGASSDDVTSDAGSAEATITTADETAGSSAGEPLLRMVGEFHWEGDAVGYVNPPSTPDGETWYFFGNLRIAGSGTLTVDYQVCAGEPTTQQFTVQVAEGGSLEVVPGPALPDGSWRFLADSVAAVQIAPGDACGELFVTVRYPEGSGKSAVTLRYLAGSVCAEGVECDFQLVWCDGEMPPPCA